MRNRLAPTETKREAILQAAAELMLKHGFRGTSMEAIARSAGVAKPTLYACFPDKTAVFAELVQRVVAEWRGNFLAALTGDGDVVTRVGAALTAKTKGTLRLISASPHAAELYSEHDRLSAPLLRDYDRQVSGALEAALREAGVAQARFLTQVLLAASFGIGHKAQSPAELGPALRLLAERLVRPELPR